MDCKPSHFVIYICTKTLAVGVEVHHRLHHSGGNTSCFDRPPYVHFLVAQ